MSDNKRYYYLKLKENFFDSDEMVLLESMPDGYIYSNILLKLYLRSLKHEGKLMFNDRIPFNSTMLATITRHSVGVVGTISVIDGLVSFVIPDNVLGFRGKCDLYIALAFADGSSSDEVHVAFTIEESPFNKTYEEAADYYIKSFDVLLKEVELATTNAINEINEQLPQVQSRLENVENGLRVAEGELEELLDGMNLQTMYSNSIDFGNYDYSGNPNLMANINADSFSQDTGALSVIDDGDEVVVTLDPNHKLDLYKVKSQPALVVGETYNMSVEIMLEDDFTGDPSTIALGYFKMPNWVPALTTPNTLTTAKND